MGAAFKNQIEIISKIQRKILKVIFGKPSRFSSTEIYNISNTLTIQQLYTKEALIYVYKNRNNIQPFRHIHDTRYLTQNPLTVSPSKTAYSQKQAHYTGIKLYNSLPTEIKNSPTLNIFKQKIKRHLRS